MVSKRHTYSYSYMVTCMSLSKTTFSLQEFLSMPNRCDRTELVNGKLNPKMSQNISTQLYNYGYCWL